MKAVLNRAKVALLMKILTILERVSRKIRAKVGVDYAIRGSIVANQGRSIPRPSMTLISREFSRRRPAGMGKFPHQIEFDSDDLSNPDLQ
ncbi:hypothetical protein TFLX_06491 [Thermoflexales bacterium]|nr:hypothetical protein TFLX_06491 [Thermoflexales bacterium]